MDGITAYCKDGKAIKIFLGSEDICSQEEKETFEKEDIRRCKDLEKLLKESYKGKDIDFSKYLDFNELDITEFEKKVYMETMKIPKGQIKTYKEIGEAIGSKGYRAVGNALNKNPIAIIVPCHRVVGSNNKLTGFSAGIDMKKEMLNNEGIKIKKEKIVNGLDESSQKQLI